jgi:hypothetical protein
MMIEVAIARVKELVQTDMCNFAACGTICWQSAGHCFLGLIMSIAVRLPGMYVQS